MGRWKKVKTDPQPGTSKLGHAGHSPLYKKTLSKTQKKQIRDIGFCDVLIGGERKRVTRSNLVRGKYIVHWYIRSDTGRVALRDYNMDASIGATYRAPTNAGMLGD